MPRTLADDIAADVSRVFLDTRHFAINVTHYPAGTIGSPATVTGIWTPETSSEDKAAGRRNSRRGCLQVDDSVVIRSDDLWQIDSEMWSTESWKTLPGGMKEARLKKADQETRTAHSSSGKY